MPGHLKIIFQRLVVTITVNISTVSEPDVSPTIPTAALVEASIMLLETPEKN